MKMQKLIFTLLPAILFVLIPHSLYGHGERQFVGMMGSIQGTLYGNSDSGLNKAHLSGVRLPLTLSVPLINFGGEMHFARDELASEQPKFFDFTIGIGLSKIFWIQYVTSKHWRFTLNLMIFSKSLVSFRKEEDDLGKVGISVSYDLPAQESEQSHYNAGVIFQLF